MAHETQILVGMFTLLWITTFTGFGWGIKILYDMNSRIADFKVEIKTEIGGLKTEMRTGFAGIKAELVAIRVRLDHLEAGLIAPR